MNLAQQTQSALGSHAHRCKYPSQANKFFFFKGNALRIIWVVII